MAQSVDVAILGGGLCGLAAAAKLGARAVVFERGDRPGGVVRTERLGEHWIDRVIHLLYFDRPETRAEMQAVMGDLLAECSPRAWVETAAGPVRYPLQFNLHELPPDDKVACLFDLADAFFNHASEPARDYEEFLSRQFGARLCDLFFFPYNRKLWRRPLRELAPTGFQWNIVRPSFRRTLAATLAGRSEAPAYNEGSVYPRPPADAPFRGSELIAQRLAARVQDLRLRHEVEAIDPRNRRIRVSAPDGRSWIDYKSCLSTLPLPQMLDMIPGLPAEIAEARATLSWNRVIGVAFALKGPRPEGIGCWRYYPDPSLVFTRLVFMHEFDPLMSPADGWSILAEIPEPSDTKPDLDAMRRRAWDDIQRVGLPLDGCERTAEAAWVVDPAYVVFTPETEGTIAAAHTFLKANGIESRGRYGRWEYSSMSQAIGDGFAFAQAALGGRA